VKLAAGARLGPYEILASLGAGGMGEVFRARDSRLGRDVAVKILPSALAGDEERRRRFELEARAAGGFNHPNIVAVYDIGHEDGTHYVVSELLEGETLRARLGEAPLPSHRALDYGLQVARGLAAAHEHGVVHRDLKPENLFVTRDGLVKILDFGLAKLAQGEEAVDSSDPAGLPTLTRGTSPGTMVGTVGYMSPEQVRGQAVDHRSDIFSLGTILYEMFAGRRAFQRASAVETLNAILKEEPPELVESGRPMPPGLDRVVRHCLEKRPEERFQSARDLLFDLETLSGLGAGGSIVARLPAAPSAARRRVRAALAIAAVAALPVVGFLAGRQAARRPLPVYHQVSFRRGTVSAARFAPDGGTLFLQRGLRRRPLRRLPGPARQPRRAGRRLPGRAPAGRRRRRDGARPARSRRKRARARAARRGSAPPHRGERRRRRLEPRRRGLRARTVQRGRGSPRVPARPRGVRDLRRRQLAPDLARR
jgi:hypothetical protein